MCVQGKGTFPCETSVLEMHTDLDWNPQVTSLNVWPLYICDDGNVIYYRWDIRLHLFPFSLPSSFSLLPSSPEGIHFVHASL